MANKMLIDATHPEETRVVVLRGNRVEEFDFESAHRKQLRGNIYLAKVTRVEPSLQAAFVEYGGNRHGFLAFSEIHPDYYQIPVADRQALIDEEERAQRAADDEADRRYRRRRRGHHHSEQRAERTDEVVRSDAIEEPADETTANGGHADAAPADTSVTDFASPEQPLEEPGEAAAASETAAPPAEWELSATWESSAPEFASPPSEAETAAESVAFSESESEGDSEVGAPPSSDDGDRDSEGGREGGEEEEVVESVGGADALEEVPDRAPRYRRQYKIQEVIKRRQVMLVQVVKEERGTKGAALTTYLSLAGRYSVLMPNTARGGGISRKITNSEDRSRLKEVAQELEVPEGMGVILRTAGANRTKTEIKRDFEYLLRLWETVRDLTLKSTAPVLVYEEGSLVKRSIRDLYNKDIDEVIVAGEQGYHEAKDFMRMLMPSHAKHVKLYTDTQPLLSRYGVENQLDAMFSPVVQLRSGGYIVLNQAEALVAIDVNSGRATREHHIEDTALKTNLEAADEIARQLRLRDLAGLIVIDFIDMDENRNNRSVERRLKECLKQDRARIQVGRISHFGLLEMSRQRIRASVLESSTEKCPYCGGSGHVRSVSSLALQVLRALEDQLMKGATHNLVARTRPEVALYVLNQKRAHLRALEERFRITITIRADENVTAPQAFVVERGEQVHSVEAAKALAEQIGTIAAPLEEEDDLEDTGDETEPAEAATEEGAAAEGERPERSGRRRRRRRRGHRGEESFRDEPPQPGFEPAADFSSDGPHGDNAADEAGAEPATATFTPGGDGEAHGDSERRRRRRGRRGGRRNRRDRDGEPRFASPDNGSAPADSSSYPDEASFEPGLTDAVVDLDTGPADAEPPHAEPPTPAAAPQAAAAEEAPLPPPPVEEPPRRRSTVREPAPTAGDNGEPVIPTAAPSPAPAPEVSESSEAEQTNQPRRTGWWSRRIMGG
jgi:ribonuclease E